MSRLFSDVLPEWPLDEVEAGLASATETDVLAALELAENGRRLNARDFMALVSPAASPYLETMARIARDVTVRQFGRSIQLFTPLYLANYCTNQCVYCGFNTKNHIHRSMLTMDEVEAEGKVIAATGLRNILLLTGDAPKLTGPAYIAEAARRLRPYFPSIGVEVYSMSEDDYRMLVDAGVDSFTMFQETYNEELYLKLHPAGPKRDFRFRLNAPDRAARAGMRSVNVGALLGLDQWRRDAFYTGLHADWIQATYPGVDIAVSAPRMRPHEGSFNDIHPASERDLVQYIQALRLYLPAAGITLSTRERPFLRDRLIGLGITKISAGVSTAVGGHAHAAQDVAEEHDTAQFEIADDRDVDQMIAAIEAQGYQPCASRGSLSTKRTPAASRRRERDVWRLGRLAGRPLGGSSVVRDVVEEVRNGGWGYWLGYGIGRASCGGTVQGVGIGAHRHGRSGRVRLQLYRLFGPDGYSGFRDCGPGCGGVVQFEPPAFFPPAFGIAEGGGAGRGLAGTESVRHPAA